MDRSGQRSWRGGYHQDRECAPAPRGHRSGMGLPTPALGRWVLRKRQEKLSEGVKEIVWKAQCSGEIQDARVDAASSLGSGKDQNHGKWRSRGTRKGESSKSACGRPSSRIRVVRPRQLPTDHDYAVPTRPNIRGSTVATAASTATCAASYDKMRDKKTIIDRSFHIRRSKDIH